MALKFMLMNLLFFIVTLVVDYVCICVFRLNTEGCLVYMITALCEVSGVLFFIGLIVVCVQIILSL